MTHFTKKAKWIGAGEGGFETGEMTPATELRRSFTVKVLPKKAECLIIGLGMYVLYINGKRVSNEVLTPPFTAYDKRVLSVRYDVSELLTEGENSVAVKLGNGFFNQTATDVWNFQHASWRNTPRLLFELFADGDSILASDTGWKCRTNGATVHNCVRTGEYYDARKHDGWNTTDYCDTGWSFAKIVHPAGGIINEMKMPPERECEQLLPIARWRCERGWIFDFGKNISGYVSLKCAARCGVALTLRYSEKLKDKELDQTQISPYVKDYPFSEDHYTFASDELEEWRPDFVYHGFRYVEFSWTSNAIPPKDALTAHFVHTDLDRRGDFRCSDELMSWIYDAGVRSFLSNYHGLPLDCPHREKNGWTGDAAISADYAAFLFDMKEPWIKWLYDMQDAQRHSGQLPGIVPTCGWGFNWGSGPAWDIAMFSLPYTLYVETGDTEALDVSYAAAEKYLAYAEGREDEDGLVCYGLSDWVPPKRLGELKEIPNRLSDSCYYYAMNAITSKNAELHGESAKAKGYMKKARQIKEAIRRAYANAEVLENSCIGSLAFLLFFEIVEGKEAEKTAKRLVSLLEADNYVHKLGILGMKALPNALSAYGYTDAAYKCLMRTDYPSYGYWKSIGETTLCENWEEDQSRNHHMFSDVVHWMIRNVAGLKNVGIAYDQIELAPYFFAEKCSASASTMTLNGEASFSWEKHGDLFAASIVIPQGSEATLILPNGKSYPVKTGKVNIKL